MFKLKIRLRFLFLNALAAWIKDIEGGIAIGIAFVDDYLE